ncbi:MAG: TSUP family transporter [Gammaproteobacteria bacterium]|nr:TSUP family transporter [Gammaproteobacteria bacterium]
MFGLCNGIATGITGSFVVPGVMYLQAIGLSKDELIQAMGILFTLSTVALAIALQNASLLTLESGIASGLAVVPAIIGMMVGQRVRSRLSEAAFRRYFLLSLGALGLYIIINAA